MNGHEPIAHIEGIKHCYGKKIALDSIDLQIPAGCEVGLIGPDGVGKSTLLGLIAGQKKIQTGDIHVLGSSMRSGIHRHDVCSEIAYIPQGLGQNLYATLSVYENVDFFGRLFGYNRDERNERIKRLLKATNLEPFANRPAGQLSGGMKQKLGLCCALIHDPDVLIMDEPTTGVDPLSRRQFWELIKGMRAHHAGMSIIVATAYMEEAEHLDWLVMMEGGRVLAAGTPTQLKKQTGKTTIEDAYIAMLPEEMRYGHRVFITPPRIASDDGSAIEAKHLTKKFGDFTAVHDVSFTIPRGEIFGFVGSNGCGKTTTMKMLTGLLHPTHGQATIFGSSVETGSVGLKKRIGYMSQNFSLYGELTVRQNLNMHAHLFDLPKEDVPFRVKEMAEKFGLNDVMDDETESLSLGIRQRLSLAVAAIHRPEILILDEPTSGVDPVARDHFWDLLINLSRADGVTIFVTTHYMNEANRCDRIALMSMGRVLACDAPKELIRMRNSSTLEGAFIAYIKDDIAENKINEMEDEKQTTPFMMKSDRIKKHGRYFDMNRLAALARREAIELFRDPIRLITSFIIAPFLLIVFGFGISTDIENIKYSVLDNDQKMLSRDYLNNFSGSRYFSGQKPIQSHFEIDKGFQSGKFNMVIEIPPGFEKDIKRGQRPSVGFWIDGTMPFRAETNKNYAEAVHQTYLISLADRSPMRMESSSTHVQPRYWYNPLLRSKYSIVPGLLAVVLMLVPAMLTAIGVVREKELGSISNFYSSPMTRLEFLWGKQIPYIVITLITFIILLVVIKFLFLIPFRGSFSALIVGTVLYIITSTGIGLLISTFTRTQIASLVAAFALTLVPSFEFSGLISPASSLVGGAEVFSRIFPARYFVNISVGTFTKAIGFPELAWNFVFLLAAYITIQTLTVLLLKKQEI